MSKNVIVSPRRADSQTGSNHDQIAPPTLNIDSSQILTLIQHHLIESSLIETSRALFSESGIGPIGLLSPAHASLNTWVRSGDWGRVLEVLSTLNLSSTLFRQILSEIHEMVILELGDIGEIDLAFVTLRVCTDHFDHRDNISNSSSHVNNRKYDHGHNDDLVASVSGLISSHSIEQRLHALSALRSLHIKSETNLLAARGSSSRSLSQSISSLPTDYYGPSSMSKQKRRDDIAKRLESLIAIIPPSRLVVLLQQAVKWQVHTGQIPMIKEIWEDDKDEAQEATSTNQDNDDHVGEKRRRKKSYPVKRKKRFDLALGEVEVHESSREKEAGRSHPKFKDSKTYESIPSELYSSIKLAKNTVVESCIFLPSASQPSIVIGSSDGFIEIWDVDSKHPELRTKDLPYQTNDDLMCHDEGVAISALAVSQDGALLASGDSQGTINVWKIDDGKCLREFKKVHAGAISCLAFSHDSSRILSSSQDSTCREYGLRTNRVLKEFRGHTSFVHACAYVVTSEEEAHDDNNDTASSQTSLIVITCSSDGTLRIWDGRSAEIKLILHLTASTGLQLQPLSHVDRVMPFSGHELGISIHTILPLHTPFNCIIVVGKLDKAYLVTISGKILRTYVGDYNMVNMDTNVSENDFVAAAVSPSNKWLYLVTQNGIFTCFDVWTGVVEKTIPNFGCQTIGGLTTNSISGLVHHPHRGTLAAYSSDKSQKRGLLVLWK